LSADPSRADEAARYFGAAIALRPGSYFVHDNLGTALTLQCRYDDALKAFETARQLNPGFGGAAVKMSETLLERLERGGGDRAPAVREGVARRKPGSSTATLSLTRAYGARAQAHAAHGDLASAGFAKTVALVAAQSGHGSGKGRVLSL